jgi:aarF domain-containing kinase
MDNWLRLLLAAAQKDREGCLRWSLKLGYLTGEENDVSHSLVFVSSFLAMSD